MVLEPETLSDFLDPQAVSPMLSAAIAAVKVNRFIYDEMRFVFCYAVLRVRYDLCTKRHKRLFLPCSNFVTVTGNGTVTLILLYMFHFRHKAMQRNRHSGLFVSFHPRRI